MGIQHPVARGVFASEHGAIARQGIISIRPERNGNLIRKGAEKVDHVAHENLIICSVKLQGSAESACRRMHDASLKLAWGQDTGGATRGNPGRFVEIPVGK
jgi:hypothetical protein